MQSSVNPFEALRFPGIPDSEDIRNNLEYIEVFNNRKEIVKVIIADAGDGKFTFGYDIYFASGRVAQKLPSLEMGFCTSRNNALLYFLGYMKKYSSHFSDLVMFEVDKLIGKIQQNSLF